MNNEPAITMDEALQLNADLSDLRTALLNYSCDKMMCADDSKTDKGDDDEVTKTRREP